MAPLVGATWPILTTRSCAETVPAKTAAAAAGDQLELDLHAITSEWV